MRIYRFVLLLFFLISCEDKNTTVPKSYQNISPPGKDFLIDSANIDAGKHLYQRHCAICHGQSGRGDGSAGHTQSLKPTNLATLTTMTSQVVFQTWI